MTKKEVAFFVGSILFMVLQVWLELKIPGYMSDITKLTVSETLKALKNKEFSAVELAKAYIKNMEEGRRYNAYITECADKAVEQAEIADKNYQSGKNRLFRRRSAVGKRHSCQHRNQRCRPHRYNGSGSPVLLQQ